MGKPVFLFFRAIKLSPQNLIGKKRFLRVETLCERDLILKYGY